MAGFTQYVIDEFCRLAEKKFYTRPSFARWVHYSFVLCARSAHNFSAPCGRTGNFRAVLQRASYPPLPAEFFFFSLLAIFLKRGSMPPPTRVARPSYITQCLPLSRPDVSSFSVHEELVVNRNLELKVFRTKVSLVFGDKWLKNLYSCRLIVSDCEVFVKKFDVWIIKAVKAG